MIRRAAAIALLLAGLLGLSACESGQGRQIGLVVGGVTGIILGSQISDNSSAAAAGAYVGYIVGSLLGAEIGAYLEEEDRGYADDAYDILLDEPAGESAYWANPDSGNYGEITPLGEPFEEGGLVCRSYAHDYVIDGRLTTETKTACQQPDGSWQGI